MPNTLAPLACRPLAIAAPMPRDARVTTAIFPSSEKRPGLRIAVAAHDGGTQFDVFGTVDLEHLVAFHQMQADPAAKAVFLVAQQARNEHVERSVLEIAFFDLL